MGEILGGRALNRTVAFLRRTGKTIVFTNGCFELLHVGHIRLLKKARSLGDALIVAINSDASVRALKGPTRPIVPALERAEVLASLEPVDYVTIFSGLTPHRVISRVQPDVLVKGGDWGKDEIVGRDVVESRGGRVVRVPLAPGHSTTLIVQKIHACSAKPSP